MLLARRDLLSALVSKEIKIRYKQSIMGFFWALLMPLLIVCSGFVINEGISTMAGRRVQHAELLSVLVKSVPWAFVVAAIRFGTGSLVGNSNLVTKIYLPGEVFPIAAVLASLFDSSIAAGVVTVILAVEGVGISPQLLWLPVILVGIVTLTIGAAMILSCANLFFRDVKYLVEVALTFGIFFTPVFYEARVFGKWATLLLANPFGSFLEALNAVVVLHRSPDTFWLAYAFVWAITAMLFAFKLFDKAQGLFAERV